MYIINTTFWLVHGDVRGSRTGVGGGHLFRCYGPARQCKRLTSRSSRQIFPFSLLQRSAWRRRRIRGLSAILNSSSHNALSLKPVTALRWVHPTVSKLSLCWSSSHYPRRHTIGTAVRPLCTSVLPDWATSRQLGYLSKLLANKKLRCFSNDSLPFSTERPEFTTTFRTSLATFLYKESGDTGVRDDFESSVDYK